jgi:hypothetical protein
MVYSSAGDGERPNGGLHGIGKGDAGPDEDLSCMGQPEPLANGVRHPTGWRLFRERRRDPMAGELAIQSAVELGCQIFQPPLAGGGRAPSDLRGTLSGALQDFGAMRAGQSNLIPRAKRQDPPAKLGWLDAVGKPIQLLQLWPVSFFETSNH